MSFFSQLTQNVTESPDNSSVAPLAAGATFTGLSISTLGVVGIQINLFSSENCTIYVDQSIDNVNWDIVDTFNYYAALGGVGFTVQATASYTRVRVTNVGAALANPFRLQTVLCPIVEAVPRALSPEGNLRVCVEQTDGDLGTHTAVSPMGALRTAEATRLVGTAFGDTFDTNFWTKTTNTGTSTSTNSGGVLSLQTNPGGGAGSGNSAIVNSARTARYVAGKSNYIRMQIACPTVVGVNTRRWGAFDASNGYYFKWDGTTFSVGSRKSGIDTDVANGSFNGKLGSTYTPTVNITTYEIVWTNRTVWFSVGGVVLHSITATTTPSVATAHLKIGLECTNGANVNNNTLNCQIASINRNGQLLTQPQFSNISTLATTVLKYGPGNLHSIVINTLPTSTGTVTLYDNTAGSGTPIAVITLNKATQASNIPASVDYRGLAFSTGLTVVTAGAAPNITVIYE